MVDHGCSFVVNGSSHKSALIRIALLDARMRGSDFRGINEVEKRNEEDSGGKCSNEQDVRELRPRIIRPWAEWTYRVCS